MSQRIPISPEIRQALDESVGGPVFLVDAANGEEMVLLRADAYGALAREFEISDTYPAQDRALAGIWDDPSLDDYNDAASSTSE